jgi:hypothetical protein
MFWWPETDNKRKDEPASHTRMMDWCQSLKLNFLSQIPMASGTRDLQSFYRHLEREVKVSGAVSPSTPNVKQPEKEAFEAIGHLTKTKTL